MLAYFFTKLLQGSKFNMFIIVIMGWDDVAMLWDDSEINRKESSTYKEFVEDTVNIVDVDDGHKDRCTWSDVFRRGMIGGGNAWS